MTAARPAARAGAPVNRGHEIAEGDVVALSGPVPYSYGYGAPVVRRPG